MRWKYSFRIYWIRICIWFIFWFCSPNPYDYYGTLKLIPAKGDNPLSISASIFLPFFNGDWWSVQANVDTDGSDTNFTLFAANEINGK